MNSGKIIELCHVVRDHEAGIRHWQEVMGAGPFFVFDIDQPGSVTYRGACVDCALKVGFAFSGSLLIELITPLRDTPSVFKEILDSRGEGYHHVMLDLDYRQGWDKFQAAGHEPAWQGRLPDGAEYVLFDTRRENGGFVELMEQTPSFHALLAAMRNAYDSWDRVSEPVRPLASLMS